MRASRREDLSRLMAKRETAMALPLVHGHRPDPDPVRRRRHPTHRLRPLRAHQIHTNKEDKPCIRPPHTLERIRQLLADRRSRLGPDAGASTVEVLGWAAMSTVAIVAIGAALQVLGVDIIELRASPTRPLTAMDEHGPSEATVERRRRRCRGDAGATFITLVMATGVVLVLLTGIIQVIVFQYGKGTVRAALDEAARAAARADGSTEICQERAANVLGDLLGGEMGDGVACDVQRRRRPQSSSRRPSTSTAGSDRSPTTTTTLTASAAKENQ